MIFLLIGDREKRKKKLHTLLDQYGTQAKHVYDNDLEGYDIQDLVSTQLGLFGDREVYVLHDLARELDLKNLLPGYAESDTLVIFSEASVTKKITEAFEKVSAHIEDFGKEIVVKEEKMNIFALADALGRKDRKELWLLFQSAQKQASSEEIHGILFWQLKNLFLVKTAKEKLAMNPYVLKKNQSFAEHWEEKEIADLSFRFVKVFHERDMYRSLAIDLEKMILSL